MERKKYIALRNKLYKIAGEVGTQAEELEERHPLAFAYRRLGDALDSIDLLGEQLGYIDPETNDLTDRRFKKKEDA